MLNPYMKKVWKNIFMLKGQPYLIGEKEECQIDIIKYLQIWKKMMIFTNCLKEYMSKIENILNDLKSHPVGTLSLYDYIPRFRSAIPTNIKNYDQIIKELDNFKIHFTHEKSRKTLISIIESIEYDFIDYEVKYSLYFIFILVMCHLYH